ncbi:hypothetical protein [Methylobacterium oxalidis]|uniref:hypothetical protein n=1 Tax=Methylobacterium oxalidis TaxID=944322 RepID=UPI003314995D
MTARVERPKKRGRPSLPPNEKKRHSMTFRLRKELRDALEELARRDGRSISEQVEYYVGQGIIVDTKLLFKDSKNELSEPIMQIAKRYVVGDRLQPLPIVREADDVAVTPSHALDDYTHFQCKGRENVALSEIDAAEFIELISALTAKYLALKPR